MYVSVYKYMHVCVCKQYIILILRLVIKSLDRSYKTQPEVRDSSYINTKIIYVTVYPKTGLRVRVNVLMAYWSDSVILS